VGYLWHDVGLHHHYFVKIYSRVLTRNHQLLRHITVVSLYPTLQPHQHNAVTGEAHKLEETIQLRRSNRTHKPPSQLVEDPQWP